ncbi:unnamed protein product [Notodromas monacha]|uniref:Uncharacterized protein n=1 Tax=Notodromas monacha TaxID=399045 RepID=A0A7R9GK18_9CRUS|nr:unnamed protein product [Notodromas monacha]CAG0924266.1 unnamed protein product [Notodromas monacha]
MCVCTAFTRNHEGQASAPLAVHTDVGGPGPPVLANASSHGGSSQNEATDAGRVQVPSDLRMVQKMALNQQVVLLLLLLLLEVEDQFLSTRSSLSATAAAADHEIVVASSLDQPAHSMSKCGSGGKSREVLQWHFTAWPDHATPPSPAALLHFVRRSSRSNFPQGASGPAGPIVVHCSAGVGRTGAYMAVHTLLAQLEATRKVGAAGVLQRMRKQRAWLVQTPEQYAFIHDSVLTACLAGDTDMPAATTAQVASHIK